MTGATLKPGAKVMVASDNPLKAFMIDRLINLRVAEGKFVTTTERR